MKKQLYKGISLFLVIVLAFGCCTTLAYGKSKTEKMTVYEQCLKDGDNVYCNTEVGIYKVNIKKNTKKRLVKIEGSDYEWGGDMKLKKGYLYFTRELGDGVNNGQQIERVKTSGKSHKVLADVTGTGLSYVIKGKNIYYKWTYWDEDSGKDKSHKKKMKLNGKNKKKTSHKIKMKRSKTNKKGYKVIYKDVGEPDEFGNYEKCKVYLKTPKKKIHIATFKW